MCHDYAHASGFNVQLDKLKFSLLLRSLSFLTCDIELRGRQRLAGDDCFVLGAKLLVLNLELLGVAAVEAGGPLQVDGLPGAT